MLGNSLFESFVINAIVRVILYINKQDQYYEFMVSRYDV